MSWVLAPSLLPPAAIALALLEMGRIAAACCPPDWAEAFGGWVWPRTLAGMVLAIEGGGEGGAESKPHKLQVRAKTATH